MTWVVGANCFNGFVCVADIQATIEFKDNKNPRYFNCVQKIHRIFDNLCVAFSGDIRSGLLILEEMYMQVPKSIKSNEYFDIDGQSKLLTDYLKNIYNKINHKEKPHLELMFLWVAQEGDEFIFRPFCMKFKSPEFRMISIPQIGLSQSGSGIRDQSYQSIVSFLSGCSSENDVYKAIFGNIDKPPNIWTVQSTKKLLFREASAINFSGVSKTFISFESEINYKDIFPEWIHNELTNVFVDLGIEYHDKNTANNHLNIIEFDFSTINEKIAILKKIQKSMIIL